MPECSDLIDLPSSGFNPSISRMDGHINHRFLDTSLSMASRPMNTHTLRLASGLIAIQGFFTAPSLAQSISVNDSASPLSTSTLLNGGRICSNVCDITGGLQDGNGKGSNLFHSFRTFNIEAENTVNFVDPGVENIFGRITEVSDLNSSNINGILSVDGTANLFLLNPNGIIFGESARLDIQGSFVTSTANSIIFSNGESFVANNGSGDSGVPNLLNIHVPVGLQFGIKPAPITIKGDSQRFFYVSNGLVSQSPDPLGLMIDSGETLAFLGGEVVVEGGNIASLGSRVVNEEGEVVSTSKGHIEIGGVGDDALVTFDSSKPQWAFDYSAADSFGNVTLSNRAAIDVSGGTAGSIHIQGKEIAFSSGAAALSQVNDSGFGGGQITIEASERINFTGANLAANNRMLTGVYVQVASASQSRATGVVTPAATGDGSSRLVVNTPELTLSDGSEIAMGMGGNGIDGLVSINAKTISLSGVANATPSGIYSSVLPPLTAAVRTVGQGGSIDIRTENLSITNGARLIADSRGNGNAGSIDIEAKDVTVDGFNTEFGQSRPSIISSVSFFPAIPGVFSEGSGSGGLVDIETETLRVSGGGQISATTDSNNPAGNIKVEATRSVLLSGIANNPADGELLGRSGLFASSRKGLGAGGDITVTTPSLSLLSGATINTSNFSSNGDASSQADIGPAGNIRVIAKSGSIVLKDDSVITTDTLSGDRANITLESESLVLRRGSRITTNAFGSAIGGNINISTEALVAFENSDITANAVDNFGGRVVVESGTILGTEYREQLTDSSDITASSALGEEFSGSVLLTTPQVDPTDGLAEMEAGISSEEQITAACEKINSNNFVATGKGGLPENAYQLATAQSVWNDFRLIEEGIATASQFSQNVSNNTEPVPTETPALVEAHSWQANGQGEIVLSAATTVPHGGYNAAACLSQRPSA